MRCLYREKIYRCGNYLEAEIYPVFAPPRSARSHKAKPTAEVQQALNQRHAERRIIRLANTNFTENDIRFDLTYSPEYAPKDPQEAQKNLQNFFRRLKRFRKKQDLPELKYIAVTEQGEKSGRYHHHIIMSGGVSINDLAKIWKKGYTAAKPLQFDERTGIAALVKYMIKNTATYRRWNASKNLTQPKVTKRDGKISVRKVKALYELDSSAAEEYEKIYPGYIFSDASAFYNDCNGGTYLAVYMYKSRNGRRNE